MNNLTIGIFNLILGIVGILIGTELYWPFKKQFEEQMKKTKPFYLYGGIGMVLWGLVNLFWL